MPIAFKIRFRRYPWAPKATLASYRLGAWTATPMYFVYCLFCAMLLHGLLDALFHAGDVSVVVALAAQIPFVMFLNRLRNKRQAAIAQQAQAEAADHQRKAQDMTGRGEDGAAYLQSVEAQVQQIGRR